MTLTWIQMFGALLFAHALADYPLQGQFLARAKNRNTPFPGVWGTAMTMHALIHAGFVGVITGSVILGLAEFCAHFFIDWAKCGDDITFNQDQAAHIVCKVAWCVAALLMR